MTFAAKPDPKKENIQGWIRLLEFIVEEDRRGLVDNWSNILKWYVSLAEGRKTYYDIPASVFDIVQYLMDIKLIENIPSLNPDVSFASVLSAIRECEKQNQEVIHLSSSEAAFELIKQDNLKSMTKKPRIIIAGAGGSGKDHLKQRYKAKGFNIHVGYTTRPARPGEENGKDYYFVTHAEFEDAIAHNQFYEYMTFKDNYYGTTHSAMNNCDVFIMTPPIVDAMTPEYRAKSFVILLDIPQSVRLERLLKRGNDKEAARRLEADVEMFWGWKNYDMIIRDPLF